MEGEEINFFPAEIQILSLWDSCSLLFPGQFYTLHFRRIQKKFIPFRLHKTSKLGITLEEMNSYIVHHRKLNIFANRGNLIVVHKKQKKQQKVQKVQNVKNALACQL